MPWTGVNLLLQVWLSDFVGKSLVKVNFGKRISLEAQGLFRIRENPAVADKKYLNHYIFPPKPAQTGLFCRIMRDSYILF